MKFYFPTTLSTTKLGDLLVLSDSGTWGDPATENEGVPVLRSTNIQHHELLLEDVAYRSIPANDKKRRLLSDGDILVTTSSGSPDHIGKCCLFNNPEKAKCYYFSNFTRRLRSEEKKLDSRWLYYWLTSDIGRFALRAMNDTTTGLRNINITRYLEQAIPLPHLAGQKRMIAILDKANEIRKKRQQAIDELNNLIPAIFYDMFGAPHTNSNNFDTDFLLNLVKKPITYGILKPGVDTIGGVPMLRIQDIKGGTVSTENLHKVTLALSNQYKRTILKGNEIVISLVGTIGIVAIVPDTLSGANVHRNLGVIVTNEKIDTIYLYSLFSLPEFERMLNVKGGIQRLLNLGDLSQTIIPIPPIELQKEFSTKVEEIQKLKRKHEQSIAGADDLFNSLVQRAFKGEL